MTLNYSTIDLDSLYVKYYEPKTKSLDFFLTFSDPTWCTVVVVGGQFINMLESVMEKLKEIGRHEHLRIPEAVFVFLDDEKYPENIFSTESRSKYSPTMVSS